MRTALNRERTNVGRMAYSDRIQDILVNSTNISVMKQLADCVSNKKSTYDEIDWHNAYIHAVKILNTSNDVVFMTQDDITNNNDVVNEIKKSHKKIIIVDKKMFDKLKTTYDIHGHEIITINTFEQKLSKERTNIIEITDLDDDERQVYEQTSKIIELAKKFKYKHAFDIKIVNFIDKNCKGVCDYSKQCIYMSRKTLSSFDSYAGTLLHEIIHESTFTKDLERNFENHLTKMIGHLCGLIIA
jgi:hypothetical protein